MEAPGLTTLIITHHYISARFMHLIQAQLHRIALAAYPMME